MKENCLIINLKAYRKGVGSKAEEIKQEIVKASKKTSKQIIVTPQIADHQKFDSDKFSKYSQHVDAVETGSHTGSILAETLSENNFDGVLINHSERRLEPEIIEKTVKRCRELNLQTIVCAQSPEECEQFSKYDPDFIAFEPPELIGGEISVSSAKPDLIKDAVEKSGNVSTLAGAGIKDKKDVEKSIELGCKGVLVASGIVKSQKPADKIIEMCDGL